MTLITKKGINEYKFTELMDFVNDSKWVKSFPFISQDIPTSDFNILGRIVNGHTGIDVQVQKSDIRPAVAVIKVQVEDQIPMIKCVVDWRKYVSFNDFILSFAVVTCLKSRASSDCSRSQIHSYSVAVSCSIFWHGFVENLYCSDVCKHVQNYYKSTEFSDIVIIVDNNEFPAHKNVLASQSPVFHKILTSDRKETREKSISFPDTDVNTIKEMLLFFYEKKFDEVEKDEQMALKLFKFATMYLINKLKTACEYLLIKNLRIDNVFNFFAVGKEYNSIILQQHAITYIKNNISDTIAIAEEENNKFTFHEKFILSSTGNQSVPRALNIANPINLPLTDTEFEISARMHYEYKLNVEIIKSNHKPAVAIRKIQIGRQKPIIDRIVDWKKIFNFRNFPVPFAFDVCKIFSDYPSYSDKTWVHIYEVPINCSVIWQGYIEDVYYLDICNHMKNYYNNTEFSDLKINVGDNEFPAHKNVLVKHSPVFYKMLTSDMIESKENVISFPDADVNTIKEMLLFFYENKLDEATKDDDMALKLFKFAVMYQIDRLKTACEYILITNLTIDNVCDLYAAGEKYNSIILQQHALIFFGNNAVEMLEATREVPQKIDTVTD